MTKRNEASDRESSREQKQGDQKLPEIEKSKKQRESVYTTYIIVTQEKVAPSLRNPKRHL